MFVVLGKLLGPDPTTRKIPLRLSSLLLLVILLLLRGVDAQTSSDPELSRRFLSGSSSSSESSSSSSSSNLGALYYFSEEEREERILQALERIAHLVATTTTAYSDEEEEEEENISTAAAAAILHSVDREPKSDPSNNSTLSLPMPNNGEGHAYLHHDPQQVPGEHQSGNEAMLVAASNVLQQQCSVESQKEHGPIETPLKFQTALSPAEHHNLKNSTAHPVAAHSVATSVASTNLPQSDPQLKVHKKRSKGTTITAPAVTPHPHTGTAAPNNIGASITTPWVRHFLSSCPSDVLLPVPKDYCSDNFNLSLLPPVIERIANNSASSNSVTSVISSTSSTKPFPFYRQALRLLLQDAPVPSHVPEPVQRAVTALYLLLHQRYALSPRGLDLLRRRFLSSTTTRSITVPRSPSRRDAIGTSMAGGTR